MRVPKGAIAVFSSLLLVLSFLFSLSSGYTFSSTGYVSMPTNVMTFSLSVVAIAVIIAFASWDDKDEEDEEDYDSSMYYPSGDRNFEKIEKLCWYSGDKKANQTKIVREMRPYIKAMRDSPDYMKTLPTGVQKELNTIYYGHSDRKSATLHLKHLRDRLADMNASYT